MKIIRVFPRRTNATPVDDLAFYDGPPLWKIEADIVHVSCVFTWDKPRAEALAYQWDRAGYKVQLGGPAYEDPGGEFTPGLYLKPGYLITSRGCNNNCWFCSVHRREGRIRELTVKQGYDILDSNLLQCSEKHIRSVFTMLDGYSDKCVKFSGGLEAAILQDWHIELFVRLKSRISTMFFAYDDDHDREPLICAAGRLYEAGFRRDKLRCYCLIGYPGDTIAKAAERLELCVSLGFVPMAMLYRTDSYQMPREWQRFQKIWDDIRIVCARNKGKFGSYFKEVTV